MDGNRQFYILALDGGGARGIYPAQVLANLEREFNVSVKDCFDLIAGTSTGSIIAGAAAVGIPMAEIVELFEEEAPRIFRKRPFSRGLFGSRYSRGTLDEVVRRHLPEISLGEVTVPLMIASSDIATGGVYVFKSRYLRELGEEYVRDGSTKLSDAILASCSAPTYFSPTNVGNFLLADGGLWANNPSIIALTEALSKFGTDLDNVRIFSIGTGHNANIYSERKWWGLLTGWERQKLVTYFMSIQSQSSTNMSHLLIKDRFLRVDPEIEDWPLDDTTHLRDLKAFADRDFTRYSGLIRNQVRMHN